MCNDDLVYQTLSREISGSRPNGRRGGIAKRGEGSPSITPTRHEQETEASYFQGATFNKEDEESNLNAYPPSPPLSPKTIAPPKARTRQLAERKRGHVRHRTSLKRRSSWNPNLKQEFLRRASIDSIIAPFNETVWLDSERGVTYARRRSSVMTTGARSISPRSQGDRRKSRKQSTLLHPSSPNIEPAADIDSMSARKGSSLLHPSRPSIDALDYPELKTIFSLPPNRLWEDDRRR
ncbi:hypothetical protein BKA58DRAFT_191127 [Alternaria rosae]|uniref:uncharacterized protein n=1 Tax=Alternaria rosae TaxID=1187941 RepID=UPI001E8CB119|nr:uncharacterized protein BKA58DRAFT_191127 [Alternaria rosae]KAH6868251.1 hypothetical protein BKA58DRAFT_191127 [Alternaria rosae]